MSCQVENYINRLMEYAKTENKEVFLLFFDLDNFKKIVDTHGYLLGNEVLKEVVEVMDHFLEGNGRVVRYEIR